MSKASRSGPRTPGKASYVDESLFGNPKPGATSTGKAQTEVINHAPTMKTGFKSDDVVTLKKEDLQRMLKPSPIMTADDIAAAKKAAETKREAAQAVSKARKEKMLKLEEEAKRQAPATETEILKKKADQGVRSHAAHLLEEQKDEVKHMNQMILYSKCVTIRDAQIEEKKQMMLEEEDENSKLDLLMEIERIKALEQYEERERQRAEERKRGSKVLEEQIALREKERIRQEELRDQERLMMLKQIERLKEEEMQTAIEKKIQAKSLMEGVMRANAEQIARKELMKEREKDEEHRIVAYIKQREMREQQLASEKERIAKEKEMEVARLRALQERANDKQAEIDELRARRYQEAKEREWRTRERAGAEKTSAMQKELREARDAQKNSAMRQRAEMAKVEHDDFLRVLDVNRAKEEEEMRQMVQTSMISQQYKEELLAQIRMNEERRKQERLEYLEEGRRIREHAAREKSRLMEIKERKLQDLESVGVPEKYRAELEKMKIG